jgi:hypothetical protein
MTIDNKIHERLKELNSELTVIEKQIHATAVRLDTVLQNELNSGVDGMYDYELEVEIECYNGDESGNPFCTLRKLQKGISSPSTRKKSNLADGVNHNEFHHWENHPMKDESHCWLYHCLYDHEHLTWEQIASIQTFCIDIIPRYQYTKSLHILK